MKKKNQKEKPKGKTKRKNQKEKSKGKIYFWKVFSSLCYILCFNSCFYCLFPCLYHWKQYPIVKKGLDLVFDLRSTTLAYTWRTNLQERDLVSYSERVKPIKTVRNVSSKGVILLGNVCLVFFLFVCLFVCLIPRFLRQ